MNKTDELLAKLGASLKESPLKAHERGGAAVAEAPRKSLVETGAKSLAEKANTGNARATIATAQAVIRKPYEAAKEIILSNEKLPEDFSQNEKTGEGSEAKHAAENNAGEKIEKLTSLELAQEYLTTGMKLQAIKGMAQGQAALELNAQREAGTLSAEADKAAKDKMAKEAELALAQTQEMLALQRAIGQLREAQEKMQAKATANPMASASAPARLGSATSAMPMGAGSFGPAGSQRQTISGWRTSTVGLYPEDYEKAYAAMSYLQQQTGQAVNLSRVVKIALRMMEVGPKMLEISSQIRAKDGRMAARVRG